MGIEIKLYPSFYLTVPEMFVKQSKIYNLNKKIEKIAGNLPKIALNQYVLKTLIDEIKMTNDIEGIVSTRKEISDILLNKKEGKQRNRLYGLVKKYQNLGKKTDIETLKNIRELYDEIVLDEVVNENIDNKLDGEYFRKNEVYVKNKTGEIIHKGVMPESKINDDCNKYYQ